MKETLQSNCFKHEAALTVREKLMTQKKEQVNEKLKTGRVAVYVSYSVLEPLMSEGKTLLKSQDPEGGYEEIWPIHGGRARRTMCF